MQNAGIQCVELLGSECEVVSFSNQICILTDVEPVPKSKDQNVYDICWNMKLNCIL